MFISAGKGIASGSEDDKKVLQEPSVNGWNKRFSGR